MNDTNFAGMWQWVRSKKLRRRINKAALVKLTLKLDEKQEWHGFYCGMREDYRSECPFYCTMGPDTQKVSNHLCLAPSHDSYWKETRDKMHGPVKIRNGGGENTVIGCYIHDFNEMGYEIMQVMEWQGKKGSFQKTFQ